MISKFIFIYTGICFEGDGVRRRNICFIFQFEFKWKLFSTVFHTEVRYRYMFESMRKLLVLNESLSFKFQMALVGCLFYQ